MFLRWLVFLVCVVLVGIFPLASSTHAQSRTGPFPGFGMYRKDFRELCEALREDGRAKRMYELLYPYSERDPNCVACRPLFLLFLQSCKEKEVKKRSARAAREPTPVESEGENSENEPLPTPQPEAASVAGPTPERDPSALVLDRISRLFIKIAENERINEEAIAALQKVVFILTDKNLTEGAEREYFGAVASYMKAPFEDLMNRPAGAKEPEGGTPSAEKAPPNVDALFE